MKDEERRDLEQTAAEETAPAEDIAEKAEDAAAEAEKVEENVKAVNERSKHTILWTGVAVIAVLAIALVIFFTSKNGASGSGSAEGEGGVISSLFGGKSGKSAEEQAREDATELNDEKIAQYETVGDSNKSGISTDVSSAGEAPAQPWTNLNDNDYGVRFATLATGYDGYFIEDGSDEEVKNVLAMQFFNDSDQAIQYAEYVFRAGDKAVNFKISNLPAGQSCVVLEANRHKYDSSEVLELVSRVVAKVDALPFASDQVLLVDNNDNSVTIMNLTGETLPMVRMFYKYFYEDQNTFLGGITYTATAEDIPAGGSVTVTPSHFESGISMFMGSGVYEKDS